MSLLLFLLNFLGGGAVTKILGVGAGALAAFGAWYKGRSDGVNAERSKTMKGEIDAINQRRKIDDDVDRAGMPANLDWLRRNRGTDT